MQLAWTKSSLLDLARRLALGILDLQRLPTSQWLPVCEQVMFVVQAWPATRHYLVPLVSFQITSCNWGRAAKLELQMLTGIARGPRHVLWPVIGTWSAAEFCKYKVRTL